MILISSLFPSPWLKKNLEVYLWRCTSMTFILTNFGIITFTIVEEIFENSSLKMVQNYPNFFVNSFTVIEENFVNSLWMTFNLTNFVMITFTIVEEILKKKYSKMVQNGSQFDSFFSYFLHYVWRKSWKYIFEDGP